MCFIEPEAIAFTRRKFLGASLAGAALAGSSLLLPGLAEGAETTTKAGGPGGAGVRFTWFGTNGWEIAFGNRTVLIDPWFGRFDSGFLTGKFNANTPISTDQGLIDKHIGKADQILVGHGHWDHLADVPIIAKKTGAMVIGSETHGNVLRAAGVPEKQIVQVKGGENMQFDGYTIEVFPGLHSLGPIKKYAVPGHLYSVPATAPSKVGEMPEGDSLIYLITIGGKYRIFAQSTANFIEREITGLRPDVALIASIFYNQIHDYTPRLLKALNHPRVLLPTHWDNFEKPFSEPPQDLRSLFGDPGNLDVWVKEARQASPKTKVVVLKFFESYAT